MTLGGKKAPCLGFKEHQGWTLGAEEGGDRTTRSAPEAPHKTQLRRLLSGEHRAVGKVARSERLLPGPALSCLLLHRKDPGSLLRSRAAPLCRAGGQGGKGGAGPVLTGSLQG